MSFDQKEFNKGRLVRQIEYGAEIIDNAKAVLTRAIEELDRYARRYSDPSKHCTSTEEEVLSSVVNHLSTYIMGNLRLDLMVSRAVDIARARAVVEADKE